MIMNDCMLLNIAQRLREVNTLLTAYTTHEQGGLSFEQALLLSLFYQDFNDTNILVREAACLVRENPGQLLEFSSSLFLKRTNTSRLTGHHCSRRTLQPFSRNTSNLLNSGTGKRGQPPPDYGASIRT